MDNICAKKKVIIFDVGDTLVNLDLLLICSLIGCKPLNFNEIKGLKINLNDYLEHHPPSERKYSSLSFVANYIMDLNELNNKEEVFNLLELECKKSSLWRVLNDEAVEVLESIKNKDIKLAVISNSDLNIKQILDEKNILKYFDHVTDSYTIGISKPDKRIFTHALNELNVLPQDALYIGDLPYLDIMGPLRAGISPILYDKLDAFSDKIKKISNESNKNLLRIRSLKELSSILNL